MSLETFPPLLLIGSRFAISGSLLLVSARLAGARMPRAKEALYSGLCGVLALGVANACLTYAELWIPSSLAALFVTTSPFWMVALDAAWKGGERLRLPVVAGLLIGFAGVGLLVGPDAWREGLGGETMRGFLLLQFGGLCWSGGSIAQRRFTRDVNAVVNGGIQQLSSGIVALIPALVLGQRPGEWGWREAGPVVYLMVFGSIVGYTSYVYALKHLPVSVVTIHVYVNPMVATALGWMFYREPFGKREALAMAVILLGVAVVQRAGHRRPSERVELPA